MSAPDTASSAAKPAARSPLAAVADALKSVALRPTQTVVTARDGSRTLQSLRSGEVHETLEPMRRALSPSDAASMSVSDVARQLADDPTRAWEVLQPRQTVRALPLSDFAAERPQADGTVRFVCVSDTHSKHATVAVPAGDVLVHAGDFTQTGRPGEVRAFCEWLAAQPHARKIVIAGNHDLTFDGASYPETHKRFGHSERLDDAACRAMLAAVPGVEYLCDSGTAVRGVTVYGSPWQPEFCGWAFNLPRGEGCRAKWRQIPTGTDVVVTHGPPLGHGDLCSSGLRAGCLDLLDELQGRVKPAFHVFGHIHEGAGATTDGTTTYVNASTCTLRYKATNPPLVFDVTARE